MIKIPSTKSHQAPPCVLDAAKASSWAEHFQADLPVGILFQANVHDGGEAAEENWAEALGLAQSQMPVRLVPLEAPEDAPLLLPESVRKALERLTLQRVDLTRSVLYQAGTATSWNLDFYGRSRVGRAAFSTDRIPDGWAQRCNAMDEVWVPSEFNRQTFAGFGVDERRIRVMHTGVDTQLFRPGLQPLNIPHSGGFNFLSVTNGRQQCGTAVLLRAYLNEFKLDEDVTLLLRILPDKDSSTDLEAELAFFIETELGLKVENTPTIIFLNVPLTQAGRARLYASANAFVLPSRGEAGAAAAWKRLRADCRSSRRSGAGLRSFCATPTAFRSRWKGSCPRRAKTNCSRGIDGLNLASTTFASRCAPSSRIPARRKSAPRKDVTMQWNTGIGVS